MSKRRKLLWQLYPSYLAIIVVSLAAMTWYSSRVLTEHSQSETLSELKAQAYLAEKLVHGELKESRASYLNQLLKNLAPKTSSRITLIMPSGKVLADSHENPNRMDNHALRPEIKDALAGRIGQSTRYSFSLNTDMTYLAIPVVDKGTVVGVVRIAEPVSKLVATLRPIYREFLAAGFVIILLAAGFSLYVSHRINKPITEMQQGAARFAAGDLDYRLSVPNSEEFGALAESMNLMASQLHSRIFTITQQRNELEAVLKGMVEAVFVVDSNEHILQINQAAEKLFQIRHEKVKNHSVQVAVRNTDFNRFVADTLGTEESIERDIVVVGDPDIFLQAHGTRLKDAQGKSMGALVVLNDVTRLITLEKIRRDFVANVSHELKTPITSIKGFLETLKEGAMNDPDNAERFLDIIIRHTDRLSAIIEDLLSLSRIERDSEKGEVAIADRPLQEVFDSVEKSLRSKAKHKNITLEFDLDDSLVAETNPTLLEQAIVNLVDNALKYSEPGSSVRIVSEKNDHEVIIRVQDQGCGIPREHLKRIFERFYRVDKARSRKVGGTGLGLAIVKHIANAHGGRIEVESSPGQGSTFSIHLPAV
jgi:two-component system phosphate regulon sensor histidine kinase PhoR